MVFSRKAHPQKDEAYGYRGVAPTFPHDVVSVVIIGTYQNVSRKYLPLYLAEFQFRYNNRKNPDVFGSAMAEC